MYVEETPLTGQILTTIQPPHRVIVATVMGRPYYNITRALRLMNIGYESLSPDQAELSSAKVIITTQSEAALVTANNKQGVVILDTDLENKDLAVSKAKILRTILGDGNYFSDDQLTIGIDPGSRIGVSVIYLHQEIVSWVASSTADVIDDISEVIGGIGSKRNVIRIGDGDIYMARQIAKSFVQKFDRNIRVELVNEHGTSRPQNTDANRRGARDKSSARNIAFRSGRIYQQVSGKLGVARGTSFGATSLSLKQEFS